MKEIVCVHRWTEWLMDKPCYPGDKPDPKRWKECRGLCKRVWYEGDPEPRVVIGRIEELT